MNVNLFLIFLEVILSFLKSFDFNLAYRLFTYTNSNYYFKYFFIFISKSADGYILFFSFFVSLLYLFNNQSLFFKLFFTTFLLNYGFYFLLKIISKRKRPYQAFNMPHIIMPPDLYSFPSGHTSSSFFIACIFSFYIPNLSFFFLSWAFLVSLSRLFLGLHYPTDIISGMILGIFSYFISFFLWV